MNKIKICDVEYEIDANAYTYFQFKQVFGRGIFQDIQILKEFFSKRIEKILELKEQKLSEKEIEKAVEKELLLQAENYIDAITRIAYIFIYTVNENFKSYKDFLKDIPRLSIDDDWVAEVTELAVEKFC